MTRIYDAYAKNLHIITCSLHRSRGVPSRLRSRSRSACKSVQTSPVTVSRKLKTSCVESSECRGHQHVVHCVVGHIVAVETSSPSMHKKSRNTRERRILLSANLINTSRSVRSLIWSARISMHEWYSSVRRSVRHSSVWALVADLERAGIMPSKRQA